MKEKESIAGRNRVLAKQKSNIKSEAKKFI